MNFNYDIIIVGSGPGGYSAAVTASRLGKRVCIIEKDEIGGICVNKGCIPTKAILKSAWVYAKLKDAGQYGVNAGDVSFDYRKIIDRAKSTAEKVRNGVETVLKSNKIDLIKGQAHLVSENTVGVNGKEITAGEIIIAAGSRPKGLKDFPFDGKQTFSSEQFLECTGLPKSVIVIGAGAIGCEWAGILSSLGVSVTLIELKDKILPDEDSDLTRVVESGLKKKGVSIKLGTAISDLKYEKAIVCINREPNLEGLDILEKKEDGWIKTDKKMQTNLPGVYAVGDIKGPPLLAYIAQAEGRVAALNACGQNAEMDYNVIPRVVFSMPELASAGVREKETDNAGVVRAYFKGLGKALADNEEEGFAKRIYNKSDLKILGVGITGVNASELISEAVFAIKLGLTVKEWMAVIRPHPVLSEIFSAAFEKV